MGTRYLSGSGVQAEHLPSREAATGLCPGETWGAPRPCVPPLLHLGVRAGQAAGGRSQPLLRAALPVSQRPPPGPCPCPACCAGGRRSRPETSPPGRAVTPAATSGQRREGALDGGREGARQREGAASPSQRSEFCPQVPAAGCAPRALVPWPPLLHARLCLLLGGAVKVHWVQPTGPPLCPGLPALPGSLGKPRGHGPACPPAPLRHQPPPSRWPRAPRFREHGTDTVSV